MAITAAINMANDQHDGDDAFENDVGAATNTTVTSLSIENQPSDVCETPHTTTMDEGVGKWPSELDENGSRTAALVVESRDQEPCNGDGASEIAIATTSGFQNTTQNEAQRSEMMSSGLSTTLPFANTDTSPGLKKTEGPSPDEGEPLCDDSHSVAVSLPSSAVNPGSDALVPTTTSEITSHEQEGSSVVQKLPSPTEAEIEPQLVPTKSAKGKARRKANKVTIPETTSVPTDTLEDIKAAARAFALSEETTKRKKPKTKPQEQQPIPPQTQPPPKNKARVRKPSAATGPTPPHQYHYQPPGAPPAYKHKRPPPQSKSSRGEGQYAPPPPPPPPPYYHYPPYDTTHVQNPSRRSAVKKTDKTTTKTSAYMPPALYHVSAADNASSESHPKGPLHHQYPSLPPPPPPSAYPPLHPHHYHPSHVWSHYYSGALYHPSSGPIAPTENTGPPRSTDMPSLATEKGSNVGKRKNDIGTSKNSIEAQLAAINSYGNRVDEDDNLDEYDRFVKLLGIDVMDDEASWTRWKDDDDEEFQLDPIEEDDDDDIDDDDDFEDEEIASPDALNTDTNKPVEKLPIDNLGMIAKHEKTKLSADEKFSYADAGGIVGITGPIVDSVDDEDVSSEWNSRFYEELAEELGGLEEEDMEAAVATLLLDYPNTSSNVKQRVDPSAPYESTSPSLGTSCPARVTPPTPSSNSSSPASAVTATSVLATVGNAGLSSPSVNRIPGMLGSSATPATAKKIQVLGEDLQQAQQLMPSSSASLSVTPPRSFRSESKHARMNDPSQRPAVVTPQQHEQLQDLLEKHYQLLMQQAVLAVRGAHAQRVKRSTTTPLHNSTQESRLNVASKKVKLSPAIEEQRQSVSELPHGGETPDELVEILDGAVGMLQDLDQNRKDSIRHYIQFHSTAPLSSLATARMMTSSGTVVRSPKRSLLSELMDTGNSSKRKKGNDQTEGGGERRLTRALFSKTLQQDQRNGKGEQRTVFDIRGLSKLNESFSLIDESVEGRRSLKGNRNNILDIPTVQKACRYVLEQAGARVDDALVPGSRDATTNFVDAKEYFGDDFEPPCTPEQELGLRRNRNLFTSGEDNLVLRGVNLYGEKQWTLIADRFLPDRSINNISQRYSKLCLLLYKAHGVHIDEKGNLAAPPKLTSADELDEVAVSKLKKVEPPAVLNVHRWSLEEDLTLLKAVPIMGSMWAEVKARLIPHRDRGHLRKRYQVLERRVKATVVRISKHEKNVLLKIPSSAVKSQHASSRTPPPHKKITVATPSSNKSKQSSSTRKQLQVSPVDPLPPSPAESADNASPTKESPILKKSSPKLKKSPALKKVPSPCKQASPELKQVSPELKQASPATRDIPPSRRKASPRTQDVAPLDNVPSAVTQAASILAQARTGTTAEPSSSTDSVKTVSSRPQPASSKYDHHPSPQHAQPAAPHNHHSPPHGKHPSQHNSAKSHPVAQPHPGSPSHHYHHLHQPPPHLLPPYPLHLYGPPPPHANYHIHPLHQSPPSSYPYHLHPYYAVPPHLYPPPHAAYHGHQQEREESSRAPQENLAQESNQDSRAAYEMLVREPSQDWSRLSDVSKVAEAEDVAAASTIVSQLAKSPAKPIDPVINEGNENSRDSFAEMSFDDTTSGLTLFDGYRASPAKVMPTAEEQATESVSFLAGVLERSTHGSSKSDVKPCNSMGPPPAKESGAEREPLSFMGSPRKRKATAALDVATPTAVRSSLFSSPGTPFGMSPGFRMSPMSKIGFSPGSMNEGVTLDTFPGGRSLDSYDAHHSFHPNASRMSVGSRVRFDDAKETPAKAELFGDNSTMLANDLEIVSALNALSHSPAKSPYGVTLPAAEYRATGSPGEGKHTASNDDRTATNGVMTSKKPKSLFEKVVGDNKIENKSVASTAKKSNTTKKRKLKF